MRKNKKTKNDKLNKIYAFIDTSMYYKSNFEFDNESFQRIITHVQRGYLGVLITDITIQEVKNNIVKCIKNATAAIRKNHYILKSNFYFKGIFDKSGANSIAKSILSKFDKFLKKAKVQVISIDSILPSNVFKLYFEQQAPFSYPNKQNEFKDAFVLKVLDNYSENNNIKINVISADKDMENYCKESTSLKYFSSCSDFLNKLIEEECPARVNVIYQFIENHEKQIFYLVNEKIKLINFDLYVDEYSYSGDVTDLKIEKNNIEKINILDYQDKACALEILVKVEILVKIKCIDPKFYLKHYENKKNVIEDCEGTSVVDELKNNFQDTIEDNMHGVFKLKVNANLSIDKANSDVINFSDIYFNEDSVFNTCKICINKGLERFAFYISTFKPYIKDYYQS